MRIRLSDGAGWVALCCIAGCQSSETQWRAAAKSTLGGPADVFAEPEPPASLRDAQAASIVVGFGERGRCSATRVGEALVLTAAHCRFGYTGTEDVGAPFVERDGVQHPLTVAEAGSFEPSRGELQDWLLLAPTDAVLDGVAIASLAPTATVTQLRRGSEALDARDVSIWSVTHPAPSYRSGWRAEMPGGQVARRGFIKSSVAYRKAMVIAASSRRIYDDRDRGVPPRPPRDWPARWASDDALDSVRVHHDRYRDAGDPILYHSADYSNGSSGGGLFAESSGALIGIVPFGASLVSRRVAYPGFGAMYGIDAICRESSVLTCAE